MRDEKRVPAVGSRRASRPNRRAFDPWEYAAAELPGVAIEEDADLRGTLGETDGVTIWLSKRLTPTAARCTLAHELAHVERGAPPADPRQAERQHRVIDRDVARVLIDFGDLLTAVRKSRILDRTVADGLNVDWPTLIDYVAALTPAEWTTVGRTFDRDTAVARTRRARLS